MAHRGIGQEELFVSEVRTAGLDGLDAGIDWGRIEGLLGTIYAARKGEKSWPPLSLFKALLLAMWHDLSDVRLSEALEDRASFRRFCGFSRTEAVPERTAFVRFRTELAQREGLSARLFCEVARQLQAQGLMVRQGTLVDATVIAAAAGPDDGEAGWNVTGKRGPVKGYKAHIATDQGSALVTKVHVTPANVQDGHGMAAVLGARPGAVYADRGYDWDALRQAVMDRGGQPRIMRRIGPKASLARREAITAWNAAIAPIRAGIEKVFGTTKRSYGLARARWRGLAKTSLQIHLTFTVYNLRRATTLRQAQPA
jgi:transposase, IS5 family